MYVVTVVIGLGMVGLAVALSTREVKTPGATQDEKTVAEYGSWVSPITSDLLLSDLHAIAPMLEVDIENKDTVYWIECRPHEQGRCVVCSKTDGYENITEWTPSQYSARTTVNDYGGGAFFVYNETVYFSNFRDQRLYRQKGTSSQPEPLTPNKSGEWRFADGEYIPKHGQIVIVREDHSVVRRNKSKEPQNTIVVVDPSTKQQLVLVEGADFYSNPRVSPNGKKMCWIQWNLPDMPWDSTELWTATLSETGMTIVPGSKERVAGGPMTSIIQPRWTPENTLTYISDRTDWWNLYHVTSNGQHVNLNRRDEEIGGPPWLFGETSYDFNPMEKEMRHIATLFKGKLEILDTRTKTSKAIHSGYAYHEVVRYGDGDNVYCLAKDPRKVTAVIKVNLRSGKVEVVRNSSSIWKVVNEKYISFPEEITYKTGENEKAYADYYRPQSKDYKGPEDTLPPLLVRAHGGPTGQTTPGMKLMLQFYTSRGFAVLDLNYRGSTGYGRPYRERLYYNWGITDNEDAAYGALHLADEGLVDRKKLTVSGQSAGGYLALSVIAFHPEVFSAAASVSGVADLELLVKKTHKFESKYLDKLIGPYPQKKNVYKQRSPINHLDKIKTPCIFFQGDADKVVSKDQAEMMFKALKAHNVTTAYVLFKGEAHGFVKAENIKKTIDGEFFFYSKVFGFDAPGINVSIPIFNLRN